MLLCLMLHSIAYIDPGTGSTFFQLLVATILGGLFAVKMAWQKFSSRLKQEPPRNANQDQRIER